MANIISDTENIIIVGVVLGVGYLLYRALSGIDLSCNPNSLWGKLFCPAGSPTGGTAGGGSPSATAMSQTPSVTGKGGSGPQVNFVDQQGNKFSCTGAGQNDSCIPCSGNICDPNGPSYPATAIQNQTADPSSGMQSISGDGGTTPVSLSTSPVVPSIPDALATPVDYSGVLIPSGAIIM